MNHINKTYQATLPQINRTHHTTLPRQKTSTRHATILQTLKKLETNLTQQYQTQLTKQITDPNGFLSADDSCFVKKGTESTGVANNTTAN